MCADGDPSWLGIIFDFAFELRRALLPFPLSYYPWYATGTSCIGSWAPPWGPPARLWAVGGGCCWHFRGRSFSWTSSLSWLGASCLREVSLSGQTTSPVSGFLLRARFPDGSPGLSSRWAPSAGSGRGVACFAQVDAATVVADILLWECFKNLCIRQVFGDLPRLLIHWFSCALGASCLQSGLFVIPGLGISSLLLLRVCEVF